MMRRAAAVTACVVLGALTAVAVAWGFKVYYCFFTPPPMSASGVLLEGDRGYTVYWRKGIGRTGYRLGVGAFLERDDIYEPILARFRSFRDDELALGGPESKQRLADLDRQIEQLEGHQQRWNALRQQTLEWYQNTSIATLPSWIGRPERSRGIDEVASSGYGWPLPCVAGQLHFPQRGGPPQMQWHWLVTTWRPAGGQMDLAMPLRPLPLGMAVNTAAFAALWGGMFWALPTLRRRRRTRRGLCPACRYPVGVSTVCTECGKPVCPRAEAQP